MSEDTQIEFPLPPRSGEAPGAAASGPEPAMIALLDGRTMSVDIQRYQSSEPKIAILDKRLREKGELPLSKIKTIHLLNSRHFHKSDAVAKGLGADATTPAAHQEFELEFADGTRLQGETLGHVIDTNGIHLFQSQAFGNYTHIFVPVLALKHHRIGPFIGDLLVQNNNVTSDQLNQGLQEQQKMRSRKLGEYLTADEIVSPEQLQQALIRQQSSPNLRLGEALLMEGLISEPQLKAALERQRDNRKTPLGEILITMGAVTEEGLKKTLASKLGIPFVNLKKFTIDRKILVRVPEKIARRHTLMPLYVHEGKLIIAVENPMNRAPIDDLRFHTKCFVEAVMASEEDIEWAINQYYTANIGTLADQLGGSEADNDSQEAEVGESDNALVRLVNKMILDAHQQRASDIHIEPYPGKRKTVVRFRKDGSLLHYVDVPYTYRNALISRIKIMANLDISERRKPQDGKIDFKKFGPANIELRVATVPTSGGMEDVVMRVLANGEPIAIEQLGLSKLNLERTQAAVAKPYGLFLVCGPTGSGKTTTLHSILGHINTPDRKIWTAEDPVEITQQGLRQVQTNAKIGLTFAYAMRSFLRADPDVIMVGEMRDQETTHIGIEASLTGHLVLSTLHTNSAPESIVRLLDMGMDPFNFADALLGILAQRLAKRLCPICTTSRTASREDVELLAREYYADSLDHKDPATQVKHDELVTRWLEEYGNGKELKFSEAVGCAECGDTGYDGRLGLHELLVASKEIKVLIQRRAPVSEIIFQAAREGMRTLKQDGIEKSLAGHTDLHQVRAVCIK